MKETLQFTSCQGVKISVILRCLVIPAKSKFKGKLYIYTLQIQM